MSADRFAEFEVCPTCKGRGGLGTGSFADPPARLPRLRG